MARYIGVAAMLPEGDRKELAIQALARSATIRDLSARPGVSRKFVCRQARKADAALDDVFLSGAPEDEVLFQLTVTKPWLRQVIVALTLICRSSYRGVVEFLRDLLGVPISIGTVHHVLQSATLPAGVVNHDQDLSGVRVGLHDEIFQGACRCWLVSMPHRLTVISWRWRNIATPTLGACICLTLPNRD
jgi:hypothetical protein